MVITTSGNPDSRSHFARTDDTKQKIQDAYILKQITQPIDFKSHKHSTKKFIKRTDYYATPQYKEYQQLPERRLKQKESARKSRKSHKEQIESRYKEYYRTHPEKAAELLKHKRYLKREYYDKGTTKKQANVERHLEAKKKLGFSYTNLYQILY